MQIIYHWAPLKAPFTKWFRKTIELGFLPPLGCTLVDKSDGVDSMYFIVKEISIDIRSGKANIYVETCGQWDYEERHEMVEILALLGWSEDARPIPRET
jgi:hypothetical protein